MYGEDDYRKQQRNVPTATEFQELLATLQLLIWSNKWIQTLPSRAANKHVENRLLSHQETAWKQRLRVDQNIGDLARSAF